MSAPGREARRDPPSGTVTFLFTDVVGSTRLWEDHAAGMHDALARHDEIIRDAIESRGGHVVKTTGDGAHAAFATAHDAIGAAVDAQRQLVHETWGLPEPIRVRIGVHTGYAREREGDYYGPALNRAARLMSIAHGGQIVISAAAEDLARDALPDGVTLADLGEHRLRDLEHAERVFQVLHGDLPREFPPLRGVDTYPTNLPQQLTSFVGRADEISEVCTALGEVRIVTLTGVGGVGKTRLAVQAAAEVLPLYSDGVWLCELGPLSDAAGIDDLVATTLSVAQHPGESLRDSIAAGLRDREMLLVLDNCEHLIAASARFVDALARACPNLRVLATSREGLGLSGERLMAIRSLAVPDEGERPEEFAEYEAVRLFVDRATDARRGFIATPENLATIAQISRRLDGIPLAIELAAARVRMMTPADIARRLDERFRLLTGGSRTAVERHQTLRAAVDWSYALLEPSEQVALDRLAVFAGGFTLDAAEAVVVDDGSDVDVIELLGQLVDKSLVVAEEDTDGATRYRLLETIRQYAAERLDGRGEGDVVRRRHAECYIALIERVEAAIPGPNEDEWVRAADREMANFRAALEWAASVGDADVALRLAVPLGQFGAPRSPGGLHRSSTCHRRAGIRCVRSRLRGLRKARSRCRGTAAPCLRGSKRCAKPSQRRIKS
jgi:predicted ATPase/class 3 adenylate cyclase